jgi:hypothetical protein
MLAGRATRNLAVEQTQLLVTRRHVDDFRAA